MVLARLQCPNCATQLTATDVLDACSVSAPESGLIRLQCPHCGAEGAVRLQDGQLELGVQPQGASSTFLPTATLAEPDLFVRRDGGWVDCWFRKIYRRFPVGA